MRANVKITGILLSYTSYSYVKKNGENAGELTEGLNIQYCSTYDLNPCTDEGTGENGIEVVTAALPYNELGNIVAVPGVYEFSCSMTNVEAKRFNRDVVLSVVRPNSVKFLGTIDTQFIPNPVAEKESKK